MSKRLHISDENYDESVARLALKHADIEFNNKGTSHAVTVIKNIFSTTEMSVKMFSEKLNGEVADEPAFITSLGRCLASGVSFELLLEEMPEEDKRSTALKTVIKASEQPNSNVSYKVISKQLLGQMKEHFTNKENIAYHFIVSDGRAFRIETDPIGFKATCNFNDTNVAEAFTKLFNKYYKEA